MAFDFDRSLLGSEFDVTEHDPITQRAIDEYVESCGEVTPAVGMAPPSFVVSLRTKHFLPRNMPNLGNAAFDAGKDIEFGAPIRVGDKLTSRSFIHDIFEKTGRTGTMAFMVLRTIVTNHEDRQVAVIDQRMMFR